MDTDRGTSGKGGSRGRKRTRMVRPYPIHTLEDALDIAVSIHERNAGLPFDRVLLARTLGTTPASSGYTMKLNSSAKYGLTQGGYNDSSISLTSRGQSLVAPKGDAELRRARVEAAMAPDVFEKFYRLLNGRQLPEDAFVQNLLQRELGIHRDLAAECLGIIKANGVYAGLITEDRGAMYVRIPQDDGTPRAVVASEPEPPAPEAPEPQPEPEEEASGPEVVRAPRPEATPGAGPGRVFIGHSGSPETARFVQSVLDQFGIPHRMAEDGDGAVPSLAGMSDVMRECTAAVLVFGGDREQASAERMAYQLLGAASVLYGERVVAIVEEGWEARAAVEGLPVVSVDPGDPERSGLRVLAGLHRAGVIRVTA